MRKSEKYTIKQLLAWIWRASHGARGQVTLSALVGITSVACSLVFVYLSKEIIDIATGVRTGNLLHYGIAMAVLMPSESLPFSLNDEYNKIETLTLTLTGVS